MEVVNDLELRSSMGLVETEPDWSRLKSECEQMETLSQRSNREMGRS